jgi:hypothetical protein
MFAAVVMKSSIFCDVKPCSPLKVNLIFKGASGIISLKIELFINNNNNKCNHASRKTTLCFSYCIKHRHNCGRKYPYINAKYFSLEHLGLDGGV